jgi:hypothetical protein
MEELIRKYPTVFVPYEGNPGNINWDCPKGWLKHVDNLCAFIEDWNLNRDEDEDQVQCTQVKDKWAELRFYTTFCDDYIDGAIALTNLLCAKSCEECGEESKFIEIQGWYYTLCDYHTADLLFERKLGEVALTDENGKIHRKFLPLQWIFNETNFNLAITRIADNEKITVINIEVKL